MNAQVVILRRKRKPRAITQALIDSKCVKIPDAGCWIWIGRTNPEGYGKIKYSNKELSAHRASYMAHVGEIKEGMSILHKCDVRSCVNPYHLYSGTHKENMRDMKNRGRVYISSGTKAVKSKITEADALNIFASNLTHHEISIQYGISKTTVSNIKRKKNWKHIHASTPLGEDMDDFPDVTCPYEPEIPSYTGEYLTDDYEGF